MVSIGLGELSCTSFMRYLYYSRVVITKNHLDYLFTRSDGIPIGIYGPAVNG